MGEALPEGSRTAELLARLAAVGGALGSQSGGGGGRYGGGLRYSDRYLEFQQRVLLRELLELLPGAPPPGQRSALTNLWGNFKLGGAAL